MMANGRKTSCRAKEPFTMKKLSNSQSLSTLRTGRMWMNTGLSMRDSSRRTVKMGLEDFSFQMAKFSKETSKMIWFGAKEY